MLIQQPCSFFNLCSCSCLPWAAPRQCCRAPKPVKFPTPLHLRLHCRIFPISEWFQSRASPSSTGLGVPGMMWSTWSTNESHRKPHTAAKPVNPRSPLRTGFHCRVFRISGSFQSGALPSSTGLWCARHGVVNMVNNRESSEDDCT